MRKIYLDVGTNKGERLLEAIHLNVFEEYHCFEPSQLHYDDLKEKWASTPTIYLYRIALGDSTGVEILYNAGATGASLYPDKKLQPYPENLQFLNNNEKVGTMRISKFLNSNFTERDHVFIKLNCEGSEYEIINDIVDCPNIRPEICLGVDFDCRKVPSLDGIYEQLLVKLHHSGIPYVDVTSIEDPRRIDLMVKMFSKRNPA